MFGIAAVVHAALLLAAVGHVLGLGLSNWTLRLWVGLVTLWLLWPIVFALHVAASRRRAYIWMCIAAAVIALPMQFYLRFLAPQVFIPNTMLSFSPYEVGPFAVGYVRGWIESKQRAGMDPIILEGYGMGGGFTPPAPPFSQEKREQYRLHIEPVAGCVIDSYIEGHALGYNTASVGEIRRRYGSAVITAAEREEAAHQKRFTDNNDAGRTAAERDARDGRLAYLLVRPVAEEEEYRRLFQQRYQIELRRVAEEGENLSEERWAYVQGYNAGASDEIARRYGETARQDLLGVDYRPVEEFRQAVAAANEGETKTGQ